MEKWIFDFVSFAPGPLWLALWLIPLHPWTNRAIDILIFVLCVIYGVLIFPGLPELTAIIASPTYEAIGDMLRKPEAVTLSWTHFVVGDLWIGRWIAQDSIRQGFPQWARLPFLLLSLFFGPLGLANYIVWKSIKNKRPAWSYYQG